MIGGKYERHTGRHAYYVPVGMDTGFIVTVFILLVQYLTIYIVKKAVPVYFVRIG